MDGHVCQSTYVTAELFTVTVWGAERSWALAAKKHLLQESMYIFCQACVQTVFTESCCSSFANSQGLEREF